MASATADAEGASTAAGDATLAALHAAQANIAATVQVLAAQATEAAATLSALESTRTVQPATPTQATFAAASAETSLYGTVPIDSDRLNIIAALAFDAAGQLLVATRAGEIYRLPDIDGDGIADDTGLIFADAEEQLGQVSGLIVRGDSLIVLNGERLSLLDDTDSDGIYETVTHLAQQMPTDQSPLQASNGIVQAPDGRLFTADISAGQILRIILRG